MMLEAYKAVLAADSGVTDNLATYDFGDGDAAAIFTVDPIPTDADLPAIILTMVGGLSFGSRDKKGGEQDVDIRVYADKTGSTEILRNITWAAWAAINRATLSLDGYEAVGCVARPPVTAPDPDGFPGFRIPTTCIFLEE